MPDASAPAAQPSPGDTLAAAVAAHQRSPSRLGFHDIIRHFVAACREVARSHTAGRLHLALTPGAIRVGEYGDIGIIGWRPPQDLVAPVGNDFVYQAPELFDTRGIGRAPSLASDIYALGAVLYECLTGRPPFEGSSREEVVARIREGLPWPPTSVARNVPPPLEAVCLKAMDPDPQQRYPSAVHLARDVERWAAGEHVLAEGPPPAFGMVRTMKRQPALALVSGLLALALLGLAVGAKAFWNQRQQLRQAAEAQVHLQTQLVEIAAAGQRAEALVRQARQQAVHAAEARHHALHGLRALVALAGMRPEDPAPLTEMKQAVLVRALAAARQIARSTDAAGGSDPPAVLDHLFLAELFLALGQPDDARRRAEIGLALVRTLAIGQPEGSLVHREVHAFARVLGQAHLGLGQPAPARDAFRQALAAAEGLARANPDSQGARRDVAASLELVGGAARLLGDLADARQTYEKLLGVVEEYAKGTDDSTTPRLSRVATCFALGEVERLDHRPEEALKRYETALTGFDNLKSEGQLKNLPQEFAQRSLIEQRVKEMRSVAQAMKSLDYALAQPSEVAGMLLISRALALVRRGQHADAAATTERLRTLRRDDPAALYNAACCFALCVAAVAPGKSAGAVTAEEMASRAVYTERAFDTLGEAVVRGWTNANHTEGDRDWAAIRTDPRFAGLIQVMRLRQAWLTFPTLP